MIDIEVFRKCAGHIMRCRAEYTITHMEWSEKFGDAATPRTPCAEENELLNNMLAASEVWDLLIPDILKLVENAVTMTRELEVFRQLAEKFSPTKPTTNQESSCE